MQRLVTNDWRQKVFFLFKKKRRPKAIFSFSKMYISTEFYAQMKRCVGKSNRSSIKKDLNTPKMKSFPLLHEMQANYTDIEVMLNVSNFDFTKIESDFRIFLKELEIEKKNSLVLLDQTRKTFIDETKDREQTKLNFTSVFYNSTLNPLLFYEICMLPMYDYNKEEKQFLFHPLTLKTSPFVKRFLNLRKMLLNVIDRRGEHLPVVNQVSQEIKNMLETLSFIFCKYTLNAKEENLANYILFNLSHIYASIIEIYGKDVKSNSPVTPRFEDLKEIKSNISAAIKRIRKLTGGIHPSWSDFKVQKSWQKECPNLKNRLTLKADSGHIHIVTSDIDDSRTNQINEINAVSISSLHNKSKDTFLEYMKDMEQSLSSYVDLQICDEAIESSFAYKDDCAVIGKNNIKVIFSNQNMDYLQAASLKKMLDKLYPELRIILDKA